MERKIPIGDCKRSAAWAPFGATFNFYSPFLFSIYLYQPFMATQTFKPRVRQFKQNAFSSWNIKLTQRIETIDHTQVNIMLRQSLLPIISILIDELYFLLFICRIVLLRHIGDKGIENWNLLWDSTACTMYNKIKRSKTCSDI